MKYCIFYSILFFLSMPFLAKTQVSGKVFYDVNANGTQQATNPTEYSLAGITVVAYKPDGTSVSTTSSATGIYSFSAAQLPSGTKTRIEFSGSPATSTTRNIGGTLVQFVTAGAGANNIDVGVAFANDQCQSNPSVITPCYVEGITPVLDVAIKFSYTNTGTTALDKTPITTSAQAGAMWGEAYSRSKKVLYMAAVLKTHVPLGAEGLDAIYTIDPNLGAPNATPWLELTDDLGIAVSPVLANPQYATNAARGVLVSPQNDASAFMDVGTVGMGDIDLSADEKTLYIVNLYDKKLYAIDVATKTLVGSYAIPNPGCSNGQARPWGLGEQAGKIYVSVTCDGSASGNPASLTDNSGVGNLSATVYRLDGAAFTQVLSFPLDYPREPPFQYTNNCKDINRWKPWTNVIPDLCADGNIAYPTPLLTDIEFDDNNNMVLGFTDRTGFQWGYNNYGPTGTTQYAMYAAGDILKACTTASGWSIESTSSACQSAGGLAINTNDPNGYTMTWGQLAKPGEFYEGDFFHGDGNFDASGLSYFPGHPEITIGGLLIVPGTGEVMSTSYDPVTGAPNYNTGGVITLSNTTGKRTRNGFQLYGTTAPGTTQGKGVGLGDLEALCEGAPIEIGNRIWNDADKDGIQDPSESVIPNVGVEIYADFNNDGIPDGAALGTTTTNASGLWLFNATNIADGDPTITGSQIGLQPYKTYLVRIANTDWNGNSGIGDLAGLVPTSPDKDVTLNGDERDNDATLSISSTPQIVITTSAFGQNNFSLDFGFKIPTCATITNPSAAQTLCIRDSTKSSSVSTSYNDTNGIRFVKFLTDQTTTNGTETATELANIYTGVTIASVTPSGASAPYTASYTFKSLDFPSIGTYYVYAILNPDQGAACRPVQEIIITVEACCKATVCLPIVVTRIN
jgi:hypothetical protein